MFYDFSPPFIRYKIFFVVVVVVGPSARLLMEDVCRFFKQRKDLANSAIFIR